MRLPGHGSRILEPAYTRTDGLIDSLMEDLPPYLDQPYALFGHSMGALISFELARAMRRNGLPLPVALFVSGHRAPHLPSTRGPIHHLPDEQFLEALARYNGTPPVALENEELMALMIPIFYIRDAEAFVLRHIAQTLAGDQEVDPPCEG